MKANSDIKAHAAELMKENDPDAWQVLSEAMHHARKGDGIDWSARIQAARIKLTLPSEQTPQDANATVTLIVRRHEDGTETTEFLDDDAEEETFPPPPVEELMILPD